MLSVWDQGLGFDPWATRIKHSIANNSPVAIVVMVLQRSKLCCLSANDRQMTKKETAQGKPMTTTINLRVASFFYPPPTLKYLGLSGLWVCHCIISVPSNFAD